MTTRTAKTRFKLYRINGSLYQVLSFNRSKSPYGQSVVDGSTGSRQHAVEVLHKLRANQS